MTVVGTGTLACFLAAAPEAIGSTGSVVALGSTGSGIALGSGITIGKAALIASGGGALLVCGLGIYALYKNWDIVKSGIREGVKWALDHRQEIETAIRIGECIYDHWEGICGAFRSVMRLLGH